MINEKVNTRNKWSEFANNRDRDGFISYAEKANKMNIYTIASILEWVIDDCYGPENKEVRGRLESMHESRMQKKNGRKEWK